MRTMPALVLTLLAASVASVVACGSDPAGSSGNPTPTNDSGTPTGDAGPDGDPGDAADVCTDTKLELGGEENASRTLFRGCTYELVSNYSVVGAGIELTVERGVTIEATGDFAMSITAGARIVARGEAARPIVMRAADSAKGWAGLGMLGTAAASPKNELHYVVVKDGGTRQRVTESDDLNPAVFVSSAELLADHLTIENAKAAGMRLYREGAKLTAGSNAIVVTGAGSWPIVLDHVHLGQLPAKQRLESNDPKRKRILSFGGDDGTITGDHVWAPQDVPIELAVGFDVGDVGKPASITIEGPNTILPRGKAFSATDGKLVMKATAQKPITFDWTDDGKYWGSIILVANNRTSVAHTSVLENVTFKHGGLGNNPVVQIIGPGGPGNIGDCSAGATVTGCTFSDRAPSTDGSNVYCISAVDHSNPYGTANTFVGCANDLQCD